MCPLAERPSVVVDLPAGRLLVDDRPVALRPKTWAVLCGLVLNPGRLLTKEELLDLAWPDTAVTEGTLGKSIGELRAALSDSREAPQWIETVARRGFRWIGNASVIARHGDAPIREDTGAVAPARPADASQPFEISSTIVARGEELRRLRAALEESRRQRRRVVFVTGEAGAGKTTLIDAFLDAEGTASPDLLIAHAQCLETSGVHEPYLPLLDALERLAGDPRHGAEVSEVLQRFAPTWTAQMPSIADTARSLVAPSVGSMLREFVRVIDELARNNALVLVLEDSHWADLASTEACAALARRRDAARLLILVSKRMAEAMVGDHPIIATRHDLTGRGIAETIELDPFGAEALSTYTAARCPGLEARADIVEILLEQTAGNPLFVRLVCDEWIERGVVAADSAGVWAPSAGRSELRRNVPDSLRALLERQIARLPSPERAVLEAASVRVGEFRTAAIAEAAAMPADAVDEICERIAARGHLLRAAPDSRSSGAVRVGTYAFEHAAIQNVVARGLPAARRRRLHRAAAHQIEAELTRGTEVPAALLAVHYEAAGESAAAIRNLREAGRQAMRLDAPRDAISILERTLELIDAAPDIPDCENEQVHTMSFLSHARQLAYGFVDRQVIELWTQTRELATATDDTRERVLADSGRIVVACVAGRYREAEEWIREALPIAELVEDIAVRKTFHFAAGTTRYRIGDMDSARHFFESALALEHKGEPVPGADLTALLQSQYAPAVALSGRFAYLREIVDDSLARANEHGHYSECVTAGMDAWALCLTHDFDAAVPIAKRSLELADAHQFNTWSTRARVMLGLADIRQGRIDEGLARVRAGFEERETEGAWVDYCAMCCLLAEFLVDAGRDGAGELLDSAASFSANADERYSDSEIDRIRAKTARLSGAKLADVEPLLRRAMEVADLRGFHWHRFLSALDLAELLTVEGRSAEVHAVLGPACACIDGAEDHRAYRRARELLAGAE